MEEIGENESLEWVASTSQGRKFLWEILSFCGIYHDIAGESNDVYKQLGKREVGLHVLALLEDVDNELIFKMMRESKNRSIIEEIKNATSDNSNTRDNSAIYDDLIGSGNSGDSADDSDYDYVSRHDSTSGGVF